MTCEVAVANKLGIALAADSAVTRTKNGDRTYASGVNKIFQLTEHDPVACLIYNNASIASVPWELIIKDFRKKSKGSFETIKQYQEEFLKHIDSNQSSGLLTDEVLEFGNYQSIYAAVYNVVSRLSNTIDNSVSSGTPLQESIESSFLIAKKYLDSIPYDNALSDIDPDGFHAEHQNVISKYLNESNDWKKYKDIQSLISDYDITKFISDSLLKEALVILRSSYTGIVIAGYGENEYLPVCREIKIYGFIGKKLLHTLGDTNEISHFGNGSFIKPFATSNMVETFMLGASDDVTVFVENSYLKSVEKTCYEVLNAHNLVADPNIVSKIIQSNLRPFSNQWISNAISAHLDPLLEIVGGLPLPELGELAETLVMLESLKEKVTRGTQSVGGPIDVAVITKAEGLVWLKRKLYFDASLNHRYMSRIQSSAGANS
ncbi:hypothetical protein [Comamonas jiangduensis]|uniref:hypothetical protein n=1 Tax=Comamonas jiangduensis TaxID=1194168 RepID=UPI0024E0E335|nr:hypothetical protein [Comamonas jiangduensis]